jgi:hypothetical protein
LNVSCLIVAPLDENDDISYCNNFLFVIKIYLLIYWFLLKKNVFANRTKYSSDILYNKNIDINYKRTSQHFSGILTIFIRYALYEQIGKLNNLKRLRARKLNVLKIVLLQ